jgi:hypothetical protein
MLQKNLIWGTYEHPKFQTTKVWILGLSLKSPKKKYHLDVALTKSQRMYYKEESGASSQRLWVV